MTFQVRTVVTAAVWLLSLWSPVVHAATVRGTVTNKTTNRPDGNDDVVLIALAQNMQEVSRTKTDAKGRYQLELPDAGMHLIRVDHQKASYFGAVPPGSSNVDVTVYDVSPKLDSVRMEADMVRMETDSQGLHVVESYFVKNESNPPRTKFGPLAFEIYLPPEAKIDASIAMGPGGMPVASSPVPDGTPGHYAFVFPVRPGETRFQVEYHVPYSGSRKMEAKVSLPTRNYAVVLPDRMNVNAENGVSFEAITGDPNTRSLLVKDIRPDKPLRFTVIGSGTLPRDTGAAQSTGGSSSTASSSPAIETRPGGGMAAPIHTADPLDKYKWWIVSGLAIALAVAAAFLLRPSSHSAVRDQSGDAGTQPLSLQQGGSFWIAALKEELFAMETERLKGQLSEEEYQTQKAAFEVVMKRALQRQSMSAMDRPEPS